MVHVHVRRLLLAPPPAAAPSSVGEGEGVGGSGRKRKERTGGEGRREARDSVSCCGATFGATMGNIVGYLEGRGVPAERARILRGVRAQLADAAGALATMNGDDVHHLARGMAACRVVGPQRGALPELPGVNPHCPRIDSKYGHVATAVGTTAALIAIFGVMCEVPAQCAHIAADESFIKAMRCAQAALAAWSTPALQLRGEHWSALEAERRALERAIDGAREASRSAARLRATPERTMALQLAWARRAAYPPHERVDPQTQPALRARARDRSLFAEWGESASASTSTSASTLDADADDWQLGLDEWALVSPASPPPPVAPLPGTTVVPLSEIRLVAEPAAAAVAAAAAAQASSDDGASFVTSSSWQTLGSAGSRASLGSLGSLGSRASQDSLDEALVRPLQRGVVVSVR